MSIFDIFKQIEEKEGKRNTATGSVSHIIVGLGNPGDKYANTRHNAGFLAIDRLADKLKVKINKIKFKATTAEATIGDKKVLLMKPQTFMNLSGEAVIEAVNFYKVEPQNVIVLCDDISLAVGKIRTRAKGSHGGQNGLRNIIALLGSDEFPRVKIGIGGKPHPDYDLADWVLSAFVKDEEADMIKAFDNANGAAQEIVTGSVQSAMNKFNG